MDKFEYFFYEWLIIKKNISMEKFEQLTPEEFQDLKLEFMKFYKELV